MSHPTALEQAAAVPIGADVLFRQHSPFVARFVAHLRVPNGEIEDHVQEVFLIVHRKGGFVPGAAKATTWLARIAINVVETRKRSRRRRREDPGDAAAEAASWQPGPEGQAVTAQALSRARRALDQLDDDQRSLFVLFEIEGESCADIAAGLAIPVGTVYSRLHAARAAFTKAYEHSMPPAREPVRRSSHE